MSWILGFVPGRKLDSHASLSPEWRERLAPFSEGSVAESLSGSYYVSCGGLKETCLTGSLPDGGSWFVVGIAFRRDGEECRILEAGDWQGFLSSHEPDFSRLGGGFVALRTMGDALEVFTDVLGVRTCYWTQLEEGVLCSTRLDWISALIGGAAPDYSAFGSHWLAFNQIGYRSLVQGTERVPPGGRLRIDRHGAGMTSRAWTSHRTAVDPATALRSFLQPIHERTLSLGLSGGIDSRALLALRPRTAAFSAHTFGPPSRADVRVARMLATTAGVPLRHVDAPHSTLRLEEIARHAAVSQAVSPVSGSIYLRFYRLLHDEGRVVVDGGFGEIMRRQFMNRLLRNGRSALLKKDAAEVFPHIAFDRGSFFERDIAEEMRSGAVDDLQVMLEDLPGTLSVEDRIDLLAVRSRLPNFFGFEQARLDGDVVSYMPFAQPDVLDAVFSLTPSERRHGRYTRSVIARYDPALLQHPLVKGDTTYSYRLPARWATPFVMVKKRLLRPAESESAMVLRSLREPLLDRVNSQEVRTCSAYDYPRLRSAVEAFYDSGRSAGHIDWWLAFDLWRETVERGLFHR